jgi:hypothetical protein
MRGGRLKRIASQGELALMELAGLSAAFITGSSRASYRHWPAIHPATTVRLRSDDHIDRMEGPSVEPKGVVMNKPGVFTAAAIAAALIPHAASASSVSSFVSAAGLDTNPCTRAMPCQTLQHAHDQSGPGGSITIVDAGNYGRIAISKSISIISEVEGDTASFGGNGIAGPAISVSAAATDVITLRGLHIDGALAVSSGGIQFNSGSQLHVHNCIIENWASQTGQGGIMFLPTGASSLVVTDTILSNNTDGSSGSGILIQPRTGGSARVSLERVTAEGNGFGVVADGTGSSTGINVTIADSVATRNANDGFLAVTPAGGPPVGMTVVNSRSTNNNYGLRSIGTNVTLRAERAAIIGNGIGLTFAGAGALLSAGNNLVEANGTNGTFSGSIALK